MSKQMGEHTDYRFPEVIEWLEQRPKILSNVESQSHPSIYETHSSEVVVSRISTYNDSGY